MLILLRFVGQNQKALVSVTRSTASATLSASDVDSLHVRRGPDERQHWRFGSALLLRTMSRCNKLCLSLRRLQPDCDEGARMPGQFHIVGPQIAPDRGLP